MSHRNIKLFEVLKSTQRVDGLTHNFYKYPARFPPNFVREVILEFSKEGNCVFDAFMGGGTTIVEAIANGRMALGIDINPISMFVTKVKTTPLSNRDKEAIIQWAESLNFEKAISSISMNDDPRLRNLPENIKCLLEYSVASIDQLKFPRLKQFARCALLRLSSWAIDCRKKIPAADEWNRRLSKQIKEMLKGLDDLVEAARSKNVPKNKITNQRLLFQGTISEAIKNRYFAKYLRKPKLLLTSPPYPGVHILYHRWQVGGRCETPVPFWIANQWDGHGGAYYTLGSRSKFGLENYFMKLTNIFWHLRHFIDPNALVIQLVAFSDPYSQVPSFLNSMRSAGFAEITPLKYSGIKRPRREVPNRKWYAYSGYNNFASQEILFFHKPR